MKAEEAKELSSKANQLRETLKEELESLYDEIKRTALGGGVAYHYHRGYLTGKGYDSKYIEGMLVSNLINNGYSVERQYNNPNKPYLLISWLWETAMFIFMLVMTLVYINLLAVFFIVCKLLKEVIGEVGDEWCC